MVNGTRNSSVDLTDSRTRAATIVLMGSCFSLFLFLTTPDFTNPYYIFGVSTMVFAVLFSVAILVSAYRK